MPEFTWTHRPTWPDKPETHETDRIVILDGVMIGRITHGERAPVVRWKWSSRWSGVDVGDADTLEGALNALRASFMAESERNPGLLEVLRQQQANAERYSKAWDDGHNL